MATKKEKGEMRISVFLDYLRRENEQAKGTKKGEKGTKIRGREEDEDEK